MLSVYVAELVQSAQERDDARVPGLRPDHVGDHSTGTEDPDPVALARRLTGREAGHAEDPDGQAANEGAPVHQSITTSVCIWNDAGIRRSQQSWICHQC